MVMLVQANEKKLTSIEKMTVSYVKRVASRGNTSVQCKPGYLRSSPNRPTLQSHKSTTTLSARNFLVARIKPG